MVIQGVDVTKLMSRMLSDIIPYCYMSGAYFGDIKKRIEITFNKNIPEFRKIDISRCNVDQLRGLGFVSSSELGVEAGYWSPQFWLALALPAGMKMYYLPDTSKSIQVNELWYNIFPEGASKLLYGVRRTSADEMWGIIDTPKGRINVPQIMAELLSLAYNMVVIPAADIIAELRSAIMRITYQFDFLDLSSLTIYQLNCFGCMKVKDKSWVYIPMWLLRLLPEKQIIFDVFNHNSTTRKNKQLINDQREGWACYYLKYGNETALTAEVKSKHQYVPSVMINMSNVKLTDFDKSVGLTIAANIHHNWVRGRINNGWKLGDTFDERQKLDPRIKPFRQLDKDAKTSITSNVGDIMLLVKGSRVNTDDTTNGEALKRVQQFLKSAESNYGVTSDGDMYWTPNVLNLDKINISERVIALANDVIYNKHEYNSSVKMKAGWAYGEKESVSRKVSPLLVPLKNLPQSELNRLKMLVYYTIKGMIACGVKIS